ncbi:MAG: hypothetical protein JNK21_08110 [Rhodospirillaceae bacterium]|nr:hypothetical protein [Rhodospirillaceae bacterium]
MRPLKALVLAAAMMLCAVPAHAEKVLRVAVTSLPADMGTPYGSITLPTLLPALAIYDPLFRFDDQGGVQPGLVERWEMTAPTRWRFHLRPNVTFSNGEPLNAAAAVEALDYLISKAGLLEVTAQLVVGLTGVRAMDDLTIEIDTAAPNVLLPRRLAGIRLPAPKLWAKLGRKDFSRAPVGTGPFAVTRWEAAKVVLAANRASWRTPRVDRLEILEVPDLSARVQALRTGAVDIAIDISSDDRSLIESTGARLVVRKTGRVQTIAFVSTKPSPVADIRVRQALNYAVDKQRMIDVLLGGTTAPASQGAVKEAFGYDPDLKPYPYDPTRARAMLAEAGYAQGFDILLSFPPGSFAADSSYHQQIVSDLRAVGVRADTETTTVPQHIQRIRTGGWPGQGFSMDYNNMPTLDALWSIRVHSCLWPAPWHCRPEWTPTIQAAEAAPTDDERLTLTRRLLKLYRDEPTGIFLWEIPGLDGVAARVALYNPGLGDVGLDAVDVLNSKTYRE